MAEVKKTTKTATKKTAEKKYLNRVHEKYVTEIAPELVKKYGNINAVPKLVKIVVNTRLGDVKDNTKSLTAAVDELGLITGQKPMVTTAKKSISNFKIRQGQKNGAKVTLRSKTMYEFFDKICSVALPRVRDFSGLSRKSFDQFGNYTFGFKEQLVFPEISYEKIEKLRGMDITIVTTAKNKEDSLELLEALGLPFKKEVK